MAKEYTNLFLNKFRDSIVGRKTTIDMFPDELTSVDIKILDQQLYNLNTSLQALSKLTNNASKEQLDSFLDTVSIIENKIDYINNVSNMLMYINTYYSDDNVLDVINSNIIKNSLHSSLVYNASKKGLTLNNYSSSFKCAKKVNGNRITFYNTNLAYHSGVNLSSVYMEYIDVKNIVIRKTNGDTVRLDIKELVNGDNYISHDLLSSTQIDIELGSSSQIDTIDLSLIDYKFIEDGSVVLDTNTFRVGNVFNYIYKCDVPSDCFINNNVTFELLDINKNTVDTVDLLLPVGKTLVCMSSYDVDFAFIGSCVGLYYNNMFTNRPSITKEYIDSIPNKKEVFIVFYPKVKDKDLKNKNITLVNNQGIVINNKNVKYLKVSSKLDFHTFNKSLTPTLKSIAGITKDD